MVSFLCCFGHNNNKKKKRVRIKKLDPPGEKTTSFDDIPIVVKVTGERKQAGGGQESLDHVDGTCQKKQQTMTKAGSGFKSVSLSSGKGVDPVSKRRVRDPLVGMWILMVTLMIFLLWGRTCAVLCVATWFYLLGRRNGYMVKDSGSDDSDLNSELKEEVRRERLKDN